MRILFAHPSAPGQFARLFHHYLQHDENQVVLIHMGSSDMALPREPPPRCRIFDVTQLASLDLDQKPYLRKLDNFIRSATAAAHIAQDLKTQGWWPDIVYSHTGFGLGAFIHNVFPDAIYVKYCEWFYRNTEDGAEFLSGPRSVDTRVGNELLNSPIWLDLTRADVMVAPTVWQRQQFPKHIRQSITVLPDGIDTDRLRPDAGASYTTPSGKTFRKGDRVITYVARGADPFRGFRSFIDALEILLAEDPLVHAIIVGDQFAHYGPTHGTSRHYDEVMADRRLDLARAHFTGTISYDDFAKVLQVSCVHVYLTAPFVLSWSALEAMSCGCAIVGSDTQPLREFVDDGAEGLLADFGDAKDIASKVMMMLADENLRSHCGENARRRVMDSWNVDHALRMHSTVVDSAIQSRPSIARIRKI